MFARATWLRAALCAALAATPVFAPSSASAAGSAQQAPRLYSPTAYGVGSARQLSLGGAFVAIADGGAFTANHASFAQPSRWLGTDLDVYVALQLTSTVGGQDLDNDLQIDRAGVRQNLLGVGMRFRRFGFGLYARTAAVCVSGPCQRGTEGDAEFTQGGFSVALAFIDGQLVAATGLHGTSARLTAHPEGSWNGGGLGFDVLWRPKGEPYRAALVYRPLSLAKLDPEVSAQPPSPSAPPRPSAVAFPATVSLGVAAKLDRGREGLNVPRERDDDPTEVVGAHSLARDVFRNRRERPPGRLLASVQLDVTVGVRDAVALGHFTQPRGSEPGHVGGSTLFTPRFGVEYVTVPGRLTLRGGTYLEPSATPGVRVRPHATAGFDLFLFHFIFDWGVTGALDVAPRVRQGSLSFGVW